MKYRNKKISIDGKKFDSKHEAERYLELKLLLRAGKIQGLQTQVRFKLIPSQKDENGKVIERPVFYIADFVYTENGKMVVEDAKGFKTKDYIIKRKLMLYLLGIRVIEV
ncbi:MAG: DUF1064 domain-containing protein [Acutalibacteraceae bacterium]